MTKFTRNSNIELLALPDCEGLLENGRCKWQHYSACSGKTCSYYRKIGSQAKAYERLRSLSESAQIHISSKYYGGARPWIKISSNTEGK